MQFPKVPKREDKALDDAVASMTDQILSGEKNELTEMNNVEVAKLQKTVLRVRAATQVDRPDALTVARIRTRLSGEWKTVWQARRPTWRWPQLAFAGALAVLLITVLVVWGNTTPETLPGAAENLTPWAPLIGILGIILIALLVWFDHRR